MLLYCLNKAAGGVKQSENVLRYIAAARPEKMLALLDEMEAKDKEISKLRSVIQASRKYVDVLENQLNGRGDND